MTSELCSCFLAILKASSYLNDRNKEQLHRVERFAVIMRMHFYMSSGSRFWHGWRADLKCIDGF